MLKDTASCDRFHLWVRGAGVTLWSFLGWSFELHEWGHCTPVSSQPTEHVTSKHRRPWIGQDRLSVKLWWRLSWVSGDRIGACPLTLPTTALCQDEGQADGEGGLPYQPASSLSSPHPHPSLVVCLSLPLSVCLIISLCLSLYRVHIRHLNCHNPLQRVLKNTYNTNFLTWSIF